MVSSGDCRRIACLTGQAKSRAYEVTFYIPEDVKDKRFVLQTHGELASSPSVGARDSLRVRFDLC